jgi:hypothetical protein
MNRYLVAAERALSRFPTSPPPEDPVVPRFTDEELRRMAGATADSVRKIRPAKAILGGEVVEFRRPTRERKQ